MKKLPGRVYWIALSCCQWLLTSLGVGTLCALKAGRTSTNRGFKLGSKLSSDLEQSILDLSKRIFRSISIKILWILHPLCCWFRVKHGRGTRCSSVTLPATWDESVGLPTEQISTPKPTSVPDHLFPEESLERSRSVSDPGIYIWLN